MSFSNITASLIGDSLVMLKGCIKQSIVVASVINNGRAFNLFQLFLPHLPEHPEGVPPHLQVLSCIRFFAEGQYQKGCGRDLYHPMAQPTVSKYLHIVCPTIIRALGHLAEFPNTAEERRRIFQSFQEIIGFLGVLGAIDCNLIDKHTPANHEEAYVNYKSKHSLNVQMICDTNYRIRALRICSGSTNDRFIWKWSQARNEMDELRARDGGYTVSPVLLTPYPRTIPDTEEIRFDTSFKAARSHKTLHYFIVTSAEILTASVLLHNYLEENEIIPPEHVEDDGPVANNAPDHEGDVLADNYAESVATRRDLTQLYF
ncbi:putative nuclease HARBI1 [Copidosoma floridanum]|uniref:putative nuclease HARBI1 n=1 Tax=Copidosoma floridanum TaxID=29053 RepID=UPI0006C976F8|nr:putative nuclease HARBI1 [Copidosoma floridanum]